MHALSRMPLFGFAALAFLMLCVVVAVAVFFAFRSGDTGKTKLGGFAGCAVGCALLGVAGLGALAVLAVVAVNLPAEWARHGPVKRLELRFDENQEGASGPALPAQPAAPAGPRVHATIELRPGADPGDVLKLFRERVSGGLSVSVSTVKRDDGEHAVIDIDAPLDEEARRDVQDLLSDLRTEAPGLNLPKGIVVEIRGPEDG